MPTTFRQYSIIYKKSSVNSTYRKCKQYIHETDVITIIIQWPISFYYNSLLLHNPA